MCSKGESIGINLLYIFFTLLKHLQAYANQILTALNRLYFLSLKH